MHITCPECKRYIKIKRRRMIVCPCGNKMSYADFFTVGRMLYIADANICLYSRNKDEKRGKACELVLRQGNVVITDTVLKEIESKFDIINTKVIKARKPSKKLLMTKTNKLKQPSETDLSIVQTAVDNPEIAGIITYDYDFANIATVGLVRENSCKNAPKFWVGDAKKFLEKQGIWSGR